MVLPRLRVVCTTQVGQASPAGACDDFLVSFFFFSPPPPFFFGFCVCFYFAILSLFNFLEAFGMRFGNLGSLFVCLCFWCRRGFVLENRLHVVRVCFGSRVCFVASVLI